MKDKPDYKRIAELERDIFGEPMTLVPPRPAVHELDSVVREVASWLAFRRTLDDFEGSRVAAAGRVVFWLALGTAALWLCLAVAGVVSWAG